MTHCQWVGCLAGATPVTQAIPALDGIRTLGDISYLDEISSHLDGTLAVERVAVASALAVGADESHYASPPIAASGLLTMSLVIRATASARSHSPKR